MRRALLKYMYCMYIILLCVYVWYVYKIIQVPKVVQVEEEYEIEVGMTEDETYEVPITSTIQVPVTTEETYFEDVAVEVAQVCVCVSVK